MGFSDHTLGSSSAIAALFNGASFFEKHITLDTQSVGPDHSFASDSHTSLTYKEDLHKSFASMHSDMFEPLSKEESLLRTKYLKSCFIITDLPAGHILTENDLVYARPGTGISVNKSLTLLGRTLRADLPAWTMLSYDHLV